MNLHLAKKLEVSFGGVGSIDGEDVIWKIGPLRACQ